MKIPQRKWSQNYIQSVITDWNDGQTMGQIARFRCVSRQVIAGILSRACGNKIELRVGQSITDTMRRNIERNRKDKLINAQKQRNPYLERVKRTPHVTAKKQIVEPVFDTDEIAPIPVWDGYLNVDLMSRADNGCAFIANEFPKRGTALYCGQPRKSGSAYCSHCHGIVYRPPVMRFKKMAAYPPKVAA